MILYFLVALSTFRFNRVTQAGVVMFVLIRVGVRKSIIEINGPDHADDVTVILL